MVDSDDKMPPITCKAVTKSFLQGEINGKLRGKQISLTNAYQRHMKRLGAQMIYDKLYLWTCNLPKLGFIHVHDGVMTQHAGSLDHLGDRRQVLMHPIHYVIHCNEVCGVTLDDKTACTVFS